MDEVSIQAELLRRIPQEVRFGLKEAVTDAYRSASRLNDRSAGCDEHTFGCMVWRMLLHRLEDTVAQLGERYGLRVASRRGVFWLEISGITIAAYRLPLNQTQSTAEAFPNNNIGAGMLTRMNVQAQIDLFETERDAIPLGLVLGHMGDQDGSAALVALLEPVAESGGRITDWGYREEIWRRVGVEITLPPAAEAEENVVSRPVVTPRVQVTQEDVPQIIIGTGTEQ
jgi:hypothetical protein